jgi:2-octaprenyl-6-methoxyphenol hydroxylase
MTDVQDAQGKPVHRSSLVWTERREVVPAMLALDDDAFAGELQRRFGGSLGRLTLWGGRRWSHPLGLLHAERYIDTRLALIGDAAHGIHPIAGQGLNLGLRDVAALAECIVDARRLGLDIGDATVLERYQRWRRLDNMALIAATDSLNRLFSNDLPPLRLLRDLGLAAVNQVPPLKRFFMRHAMGMVGELPRLVKGESL